MPNSEGNSCSSPLEVIARRPPAKVEADGVHDAMPPPESPAQAARLDMELIGRMRSSNGDLLIRLIETYLNYAPKGVAQLLAAAAGKNAESMRTAAHSLKSSSANVGAMQLSALCRDLEQRLKTGAIPDASKCEELVANIDHEFSSVTSDLRQVQMSMTRAAQTSKARA